MTQIEFRSVSMKRGEFPALVEASFVVEEAAALLGPSGSGKTTLVRLLAGLDAPTTGEILIDGRIVSSAGAIRVAPHGRGVAMVFQDLALWPNLTVRENVELGGAKADEALALCGIAALADRKPGTLSGGEQQRAALARALAARPSILLLDEPFAGLDLVTKTRLLADVASLASEKQILLVLVTHDPMEVRRLCRSAVVLEGGRVVESGRLDDLRREAKSELIRMMLRE